jgi:DNA adenine methylase
MSYPGSKAQAGVWQRIIGQMPPHSVYIEPFFGSGQVFWRKRPATNRSYIIDADAGVIDAAKKKLESQPPQFPKRVEFHICDALRWFRQDLDWFPSDTVIYCDPPYLLSTRNGRRYYDHEMTEADHRAMLSLLRNLECDVMISSYPNKLYKVELRDWRCISYKTRTRGRTLTECLWCNFPEPTELHDWRYAGKTFRERTGLKRLAARWLAKLDNMPPRKRGYVLHAISQRQSQPEDPS